mmetsp:Transcript_32199/g.63876  ORF Transcript_32199/g.63876 Transcript_32199/m.63876 type:complete len:214 (-) Transcript_32199:766-1407(-)
MLGALGPSRVGWFLRAVTRATHSTVTSRDQGKSHLNPGMEEFRRSLQGPGGLYRADVHDSPPAPPPSTASGVRTTAKGTTETSGRTRTNRLFSFFPVPISRIMARAANSSPMRALYPSTSFIAFSMPLGGWFLSTTRKKEGGWRGCCERASTEDCDSILSRVREANAAIRLHTRVTKPSTVVSSLLALCRASFLNSCCGMSSGLLLVCLIADP